MSGKKVRTNKFMVLQVETIGEEGDHPSLDVTVELLELVVLVGVEVEAVPDRVEVEDALLKRTGPRAVDV